MNPSLFKYNINGYIYGRTSYKVNSKYCHSSLMYYSFLSKEGERELKVNMINPLNSTVEQISRFSGFHNISYITYNNIIRSVIDQISLLHFQFYCIQILSKWKYYIYNNSKINILTILYLSSCLEHLIEFHTILFKGDIFIA